MDLSKAIYCLKNGQVIIYPTESCYALGVDAKNEKALKILHQTKQELKGKPVPIIVSDLKQLDTLAHLNQSAQKLSRKFHPGQLNLIVDFIEPQKYKFLSSSGLCFRIPKKDICLTLCEKFGSAITTTSANIHGQKSIYKIDQIRKVFSDKVCQIIDASNLDESVPVSTIYDTRTKTIIRKGLITKKEIDEVFR